MTNKRKIFQKTLALAKSKIEEKKIEKTKETELETQILKQSQTKIDNQNKEIKSMKLTKEQKSDIAKLKAVAEAFALINKTSAKEEEGKLLKAYTVETKSAELTTDHPDLMNEVRASDMKISFDPNAADAMLLARFERVDMNGLHKKTLLYDANDAELQHLTEVQEMVEQTFDEIPKVITVSRAGMKFSLSRTLQEHSTVDILRYLNDQLSKKVSKSLVNGIINGKSATSGDADILAATDIRQKMAGMRATLADASLTHNFSAAALSASNVSAFLNSAGQKFIDNSASWIILAGSREAAALAALVNADGPTGVTGISNGVLRPNKVFGVEVIQVGHLKNVIGSGTGYDANGFVGSTPADNDHGVLVLINPKAVYYAYEAERTDVEYKPGSDTFNLYLNARAGWVIVNTARDINGRYGVNIGADIP